jgi:dipeptidyl aminopeptidase/acylaminoacyl peptidase
MKLVSALESAGKDFELAIYPGANHIVMTAPVWQARMRAFFRRSLLEQGSAGMHSEHESR